MKTSASKINVANRPFTHITHVPLTLVPATTVTATSAYNRVDSAGIGVNNFSPGYLYREPYTRLTGPPYHTDVLTYICADRLDTSYSIRYARITSTLCFVEDLLNFVHIGRFG